MAPADGLAQLAGKLASFQLGISAYNAKQLLKIPIQANQLTGRKVFGEEIRWKKGGDGEKRTDEIDYKDRKG
jgi:hypothetical protein